jgi:hypothetical protein
MGEDARLSKAQLVHKKRPPGGGLSSASNSILESGFDLETPSLKQRLRDVLGILVTARPLAQPGRPQVLVRSELILFHHLLKLSDSGDNWTDWLWFAPVWISASLGHESSLIRFLLLNTLDSRDLQKDSKNLHHNKQN